MLVLLGNADVRIKKEPNKTVTGFNSPIKILQDIYILDNFNIKTEILKKKL